MTITVTNKTKVDLKISINKWEKSGDTDFFTINPNKSDSWNRSDSRGYVLYIAGNNEYSGPYYVSRGKNVVFHENGGVDNGIKI